MRREKAVWGHPASQVGQMAARESALEEFRDGSDSGNGGYGRPPLNPQRPVEVGLHGGDFSSDGGDVGLEVGLDGGDFSSDGGDFSLDVGLDGGDFSLEVGPDGGDFSLDVGLCGELVKVGVA